MKLNFLGIFASAAFSLAAILPATAATQTAVAPQADQQAAQAAKIVILAVIVERDGSISNATVEKSSGTAAADFAAIDHARHLKLAPKVENGVAVRAQSKIAIAVRPRNASAPAVPPAASQAPAVPVAQPTLKPVTLINI